ncbi:MAG: type I-D CRISPR-associated endonuclease Cas1 [Synechococcaceae cyanobacterium SM2_3_1]|nr:type I-D CRISPR-associated endonuclease Cas1 [Synechococcaceae cyanobacterium SM2_3_1]
MGTVYITQADAFVGKQDERLLVKAEKQTLLDLPLLHVEGIVILGRATISPAALIELLQRQIPMSYLTGSGRYLGRLEPELSKNVVVRAAQWGASEATKLHICQAIVRGKLKNYRTALQRAARDHDQASLSPVVDRLRRQIKTVGNCSEINGLRGMEGAGSADYFQCFPQLIRNDLFRFSKRQRRPPRDPVNALLSFAYALLRHDLQGAINIVGMDPYCGYLHTERYGRPSLALDLMEEFRPLVADAVVLSALNRKELTPEDFEVEEVSGAVSLRSDPLKLFLRLYEQKMQSKFKHPVMGRQCTYREAMEIQVRLLAKFLQTEISEYPPLVLR